MGSFLMRNSTRVRVLVVEDDLAKRDAVRSALDSAEFANDKLTLAITEVGCFQDAQSEMERQFFDVVILDLKIPIVDGGEARLETSRDLYRSIRKSRLPKPFHIVGLTSAPESEVAKVFSKETGLSIHRFEANGTWLNDIIELLDFVDAAKLGLLSHLSNSYGLDALFITARKSNEFDAVDELISWRGDDTNRDPRLGDMHNKFGRIRLSEGVIINAGLVCLDEMGLSHSASVTSMLISIFRPRYLAMLGMCCGLQRSSKVGREEALTSTKLGDIVIASKSYCWEEGKYTDAEVKDSPLFNNRASHKQPARSYAKRIERFFDEHGKTIEGDLAEFYASEDSEEIKKSLPDGVEFRHDAKVHIAPVVSGPCVVDSQRLIDEIESRFPQALGLEMEAHSIYSASDCVIGAAPKTIVIKGVADFGDGTKTKAIQPLASAASFMVLMALLRSEFKS